MPEFILDRGDDESAAWFASLDEFTQGYVECAFFCGVSNEEGTRDIDIDLSMLADETRLAFHDQANNFLIRAVAADALAEIEALPDRHDDSAMTRAGRDFWYTRNGHGVGFWEDDRWPEELGAKLCKIAKSFGECNLYLGDDDKLYIS